MLTILKLLGMVNPFVPMTEISPLICVYFNNLRPSCRDIVSYAFQKSVTWYKNNWRNCHSFIENIIKIRFTIHVITRNLDDHCGAEYRHIQDVLWSLTKLSTTKNGDEVTFAMMFWKWFLHWTRVGSPSCIHCVVLHYLTPSVRECEKFSVIL